MPLFRELNRGKCKTYLVGCERTRKALLIDPVRDNVSRYLAFLAYHRLELDAIVDTHTHADHPTGSFVLKDLTDARLIMHRRAPVPAVTDHVEHGDTIAAGDVTLRVLYTPGHTPDSISLHVADRVFTGDVLLIGGTGRADFAGGDAGQQYDSITQRLFTLADETLVFPAHDYRGKQIVAVCRSGVRSTTAAAILEGLGFERVYNLKDGMVEWNDRGLPVER